METPPVKDPAPKPPPAKKKPWHAPQFTTLDIGKTNNGGGPGADSMSHS